MALIPNRDEVEEEISAARALRRYYDERDRVEDASHRNESRRRTSGSLQSLLFSGTRMLPVSGFRYEPLDFFHDTNWEFYNRRRAVEIPREPLASNVGGLLLPPPCAFLRPGMQFKGEQCARKMDDYGTSFERVWNSRVIIHTFDHRKGILTGSIEADLPESPVVTFFTGEVIDNVNHSFYYQSHLGWPNTASMDLQQWRRLPGFDRKLFKEVKRFGGRAPSLADDESRIFMRWKEQSFIQGGECQLTIAGFYVGSLNRRTGDINALYIDPNCYPGQRLRLKVVSESPCGISFPAVELA